MKAVIDIAHPAHVHFYRHLLLEMLSAGDSFVVASRDKDVSVDLLNAYQIPHVTLSSGGGGRGSQARELIDRVSALRGVIDTFEPDVILTRNPAGVLAGRVTGTSTVFDTDDGRHAGTHYWAAGPLATWITAPECLADSVPRRTIRYPSYKALAYLHPNRFSPDRSILTRLGIQDSPYFLVRFVAMTASHDRRSYRMSYRSREALIHRLREFGQVIVSVEGQPPHVDGHPQPIAVEELHHLIAFTSLVIGDSQTMAAEAAILGVPTVHLSPWARRLPYLIELEDRYGLITAFSPHQVDLASDLAVELANDRQARSRWEEKREAMLSDHVDLTTWYMDFIHSIAERR